MVDITRSVELELTYYDKRRLMKHKLTPIKGTTKTNIVERTIGRAVGVEPATEPFGPASEDLLGDVFHALYDTEFEPLKPKQVPSTRTINHALMRWMNRDEEFMSARSKTSGRLAHSIISSKFLYEYLITDEAIREALKVQEEEEKRNPNAQGAGEDDEEEDQGSKKMQDAVSRLSKLAKNVIGSQIMSLGAKKAEEEADKVEGAMKAWGVEPGDVSLINIEDVLRLVDHNNEKMNKIAELAGRFESVAASALEKVRESYIGQVVDTKRTKDFSMMYGTELCYLMSPDVPPAIHALYASDFIGAGLLGVEVRSEGKEFGSLHMEVDGSGSMSGETEIYAKAIAIGLAKALNRDTLNNREYVLSTFSSGGDSFFTVTSDDDWKAHFEWASKMQGGGTDFDYAFKHAMKSIKDMPEGTDLVFITDGECDLSRDTIQKWKQFKSETGTRLLYVDVSGGSVNVTLRNLCDLYLKVEMKGEDMDIIATDIADKLAENMEKSRLDRMGDEGDD